MAGSSTADAPAFYFDFASPDCYLAAERAVHELGGSVRWVAVRASALPGGLRFGGWRCAEEREIELARIEREAAARGLQPLRWPAELPVDSSLALLAATYAASIGRAVAFALAAFRQIYAAGRDPADVDTVLIAAAACEMHPAAVLKALERASVREALDDATAEAAARGVVAVPAVLHAVRMGRGRLPLTETERPDPSDTPSR